MTTDTTSIIQYHFWFPTKYLGRSDVIHNIQHPKRVCGWLQAKIRPCEKHQTADLIWYGKCDGCWANYKKDNEWMWDY